MSDIKNQHSKCFVELINIAMKDLKNNAGSTSKAEDEVKAAHADKNSKGRKVDEGFKTSDKKYHKQEWTEPLDEQQFDDTNLSEGRE